MAPVVLLLLLAEPKPVTLAAPAFSVSGVEPARARAWSDFFAQQLSGYSISVITESDMAAALGAERQRELLGCAESCTAELLGALNSDGVLLGSVSSAEATIVLNVRVLSQQAQPLAAASWSGEGEAKVLDGLREMAAKVSEQLAARLGAERVPAPRSGSGLLKRHALFPGGLTLALAVTGAIGLGVAAKTHGELRDGSGGYANPASLDQAIAEARVWNTAGLVAISVAAVALIATVLVYLVGEAEVAPAAAVANAWAGLLAWW